MLPSLCSVVLLFSVNRLVGTESLKSHPDKKELKVDNWIEQRLNHFDALDEREWRQRYLKSDAFHRPGGPAILCIGGETRFSHFKLQSTDLLNRIARELGAMLFYLEHRFYGYLKPTVDSSAQNLRYLSSRQALEDLAVFVRNITLSSNGRLNKWILFGSSYAGSLAVWAKLKFPHFVFAVVAVSPPLRAKLMFHEYMISVNETLYKYGGETCHNSIGDANREITEMTKSASGRKELGKVFNICGNLKSNHNTLSVFRSVLNNHVESIVQFSKGNVLFKKPGTVYLTIHEMCNIMSDTTLGSPMKRFAHLVNVRRNSSLCVNTNFEDYVQAMREETWGERSDGRSWVYQACTEFGWFQIVTGNPFQPVPESFPIELCKAIFAPIMKGNVILQAPEMTNIEYGGIEVANLLARTVIFNGGVDPWHKVSYYEPNVHLRSDKIQTFSSNSTTFGNVFEDPYGFNSIFVNSSSHAEIVRWESIHDSMELKNARNAVIALLDLWLKK